MFWPGDDSWMNNTNGHLPNNPSDTADGGGHEIVIAGYDDTKQAWIMRNHWTNQWGMEGYAYLPYDLPAPFLPSDVYTIKVD
jgi:C1A family cysteine protease